MQLQKDANKLFMQQNWDENYGPAPMM